MLVWGSRAGSVGCLRVVEVKAAAWSYLQPSPSAGFLPELEHLSGLNEPTYLLIPLLTSVGLYSLPWVYGASQINLHEYGWNRLQTCWDPPLPFAASPLVSAGCWASPGAALPSVPRSLQAAAGTKWSGGEAAVLSSPHPDVKRLSGGLQILGNRCNVATPRVGATPWLSHDAAQDVDVPLSANWVVSGHKQDAQEGKRHEVLRWRGGIAKPCRLLWTKGAGKLCFCGLPWLQTACFLGCYI